MNAERDTDRRLRAWISEGADRAPERFVWAAMDDIERLSQRPSWRTALDARLAGRAGAWLRPLAGLAAVAAVIAVALAIAVLRPAPSVGPAQRFEAPDLDTIVISWQDWAPANWRLDNLVSNPTEVRRIPIRSMTAAQIEALVDPPGMVAGRYTDFSGQPGGAFMSWALLFEDELDAAAALPFYHHELSSEDAWGLGPPEPVGLGDEGYLYEGETTAFVGQPTGSDPHPGAVYIWRDDNLLLAVGGWFEFDPAQLRAAAEGMDQRAAAIGER